MGDGLGLSQIGLSEPVTDTRASGTSVPGWPGIQRPIDPLDLNSVCHPIKLILATSVLIAKVPKFEIEEDIGIVSWQSGSNQPQQSSNSGSTFPPIKSENERPRVEDLVADARGQMRTPVEFIISHLNWIDRKTYSTKGSQAEWLPSSSTDPQTQNNNGNSPGRKDKDDRDSDKPDEGKKGSSYLVLVAVAIIVKILYARKYRKRNPEIDELDPEVVEQDERLAMERRGEEVGLPTYRESTVVRNNETVLASTPITSTPFARESMTETLPRDLTQEIVADETTTYPLEDHDETARPPKYEDDASGTARPTPNPPSSLDINNEMRMSTLSAATLVVPTIADHRAIGHENSQSSNPPSSPPPPLTPPPPASTLTTWVTTTTIIIIAPTSSPISPARSNGMIPNFNDLSGIGPSIFFSS
ncbi:hypothetical protein Pst134EA_031769 [Puccinia striiformis f. sp. tritici]|uniref:uncharacterized protein n=1 Tax=Puccinia striiformis f. sp. tritici TaxID=168172 RepID=UPI0020082998|nr:uncharacterized protein Pst134EA_031769 [Puccinia striiformis f. sp. tritici]KAH9442613.1 hypothetical protein Pst134EA_031769 [Puccinia striiformis f. sp. tritici]